MRSTTRRSCGSGGYIIQVRIVAQVIDQQVNEPPRLRRSVTALAMQHADRQRVRFRRYAYDLALVSVWGGMTPSEWRERQRRGGSAR